MISSYCLPNAVRHLLYIILYVSRTDAISTGQCLSPSRQIFKVLQSTLNSSCTIFAIFSEIKPSCERTSRRSAALRNDVVESLTCWIRTREDDAQLLFCSTTKVDSLDFVAFYRLWSLFYLFVIEKDHSTHSGMTVHCCLLVIVALVLTPVL